VALTLFTCAGGRLGLPERGSALVDRADGGNLIVHPPRDVWERSELTPRELTLFSFLVAAAGRAMLDTLPQLEGGCVNYWEAGNWALHDEAPPAGPKAARPHRRVHLHLLGRSRGAASPAWRWGEAPAFPRYGERREWSEPFERLTAHECAAVVGAAERILRERYELGESALAPWRLCGSCGYPGADEACGECGCR
jgi:hypothetical protein